MDGRRWRVREREGRREKGEEEEGRKRDGKMIGNQSLQSLLADKYS